MVDVIAELGRLISTLDVDCSASKINEWIKCHANVLNIDTPSPVAPQTHLGPSPTSQYGSLDMSIWTDENLVLLNDMFEGVTKGREHIREKLFDIPSFNLFSMQQWEEINVVTRDIKEQEEVSAKQVEQFCFKSLIFFFIVLIWHV